MNNLYKNYVKAFESYRLTDRQTDTTEIICHAASRVVKNTREPRSNITHAAGVAADSADCECR